MEKHTTETGQPHELAALSNQEAEKTCNAMRERHEMVETFAIDACEAKVAQLAESYQNLKLQLAQRCSKVCSTFPAESVDVGYQDMEQDVNSIIANVTCRHYLLYLVQLQAILRATEKLVRNIERASKLSEPLGNSMFLGELSQSVESMNQCIAYAVTLGDLNERAACFGVDIGSCGASYVARTDDACLKLKEAIRRYTQSCLDLCNWPPHFLAESSKGNGPIGQSWNGFEEAGDQVFGILQQLFVISISLQMAHEHAQFSKLNSNVALYEDCPILWPAKELTSKVIVWLFSHFASEMPTARLDKPEWLFAAVLQLVKKCTPYVQLFEPCLEAHQIQKYYSMSIEFARSLQSDGIGPLLREHYFPLMLQQNEPAYWLHFVDEAIKFEGKYASYSRDALLFSGEEDIGHKNSCIEILFEEEEWAAAWLDAEAHDAEQRVLDLTNNPDQWKPTTSASATHDGIDAEYKDPKYHQLASAHEFCPPTIALETMHILTDLMKRFNYIYDSQNKAMWCRVVVKRVLDALRSHLSSELKRIDQFDHTLDESGLPILGGCLNGLHYLEHVLQEPSGMLLEALASSPDIDAFFDRESRLCSSIRRQWTNKLIKRAMEFVFSTFEQHQVLHFMHSPSNVEGEDGAVLPDPAVLELQHHISVLLNRLSHYLDQVTFREAWKGMAMSTNESYLEQLVEAASEGPMWKEQIDKIKANLDALISSYAGFTKRPQAYFKSSIQWIASSN